MHICADVGSTHLGNKDLAISGIHIAKDIGCDSVKFQLFPDLPKYTNCGNIPLPFEWVPDLIAEGKSVGIPVAFSYFDGLLYDGLDLTDVPYHKIAYSQKDHAAVKRAINQNKRLVISCDFMSDARIPNKDNIAKLYCLPVYPVPYKVSFNGIFPRFDGFSDHTMGYDQTVLAVGYGARWIEKHLSLTEDRAACPDASFALQPDEFREMVRVIGV